MNKKRIVFICFYDRICLGLRYLSTLLKEAGHEPHIIFIKEDRAAPIQRLKKDSIQYQMLWLDKFWGCGQDISPISQTEWDLAAQLVAEIKPHVIGISARGVHTELAAQTADFLRQKAPNATFLAGGYGPMLEAERYLASFDYVCIGEGDGMIVPFVETESPESVANIAYIKYGRLNYNEMMDPVDIDTLAHPDWNPENKYMIEDDQIRYGSTFYDPQTYDIFASRGCPSKCTYCMACHWDSMIGKYGTKFPKVRVRSPESVIDELLFARSAYDIQLVRFKDDIFGLNEKWLLKFMDLYDRQIGLKFHCLQDPRYATRIKAERLYTSGLDKTTVGIQSAYEPIRRKCFNRQISDDKLIEYAEMLTDVGIQLKYDMIGWNPFETHDTLMKGLDFLEGMPKSTETAVFELKMFAGSPIRELYDREQPEPLSQDSYTYWALLYQMALFSDQTRKMARELIQQQDFTLDSAMAAFKKGQQLRFGKLRVASNVDIQKNRSITGGQIELVSTDKPGITGDNYYNVIGMRAKNFVKAGTVLDWEDLYHSYQGIRERSSHTHLADLD